MSTTRVSTKFQIVIPRDVREKVQVSPGQKFQVIVKDGVISLVPERSMASMRGIAKGVATTGFREKSG